jgi:glycosyltransferase involved in cell wall biosynthesis
VEFAGWVDDVAACLARIDLLLVPSAGHEATTRVILEAFAAGVPVIAFPSGGIPEVIVNGVDSFLATTPQEMADQAVALLTSQAGEAISRNARETWVRRFTLERYRSEMLAALCAAASRAQT